MQNYVPNNFHLVRVRARLPNGGEQLTLTVALNKVPPSIQCFWQFWRIFKHGMLHLNGEDEPFVDFDCPAEELYNKQFEFRPWTPNYEHLRAEVEALPMDHMSLSPFQPI